MTIKSPPIKSPFEPLRFPDGPISPDMLRQNFDRIKAWAAGLAVRIQTNYVTLPTATALPTVDDDTPSIFGDPGVAMGGSGEDGQDGLTVPGAAGVAGAPGTIGPPGPSGMHIWGNDGEDGSDAFVRGSNGANGGSGAAGSAGAPGPTGLPIWGNDGEDGAEGMTMPGTLQAIPANTLLGNPTGSVAIPSPIALGTTSGVLQYVNGSPDTLAVFAAGAARVPFGSGTAGGLTDAASLQFGASVLRIGDGSAQPGIEWWLDNTPTFAVNVGLGVPGGASTHDLVFSTFNGATWSERGRFVNGGSLKVASLTTALTKAVSGVLTDAVAGTDYQGVITWPASGQVLTSAGTSASPTGDSTFTFNQVAHVMAGGNAIGINGVSVPTNASLVVGHTTATDRDRVQFFVGGGTLGGGGTSDSILFDVNPSSTAITAGVTGGIYATQRIRAGGYTSGGGTVAPTTIASLYIDGPPTTGGSVSSSAYPLQVASGVVLIPFLKATSLVAGGALATDTTGVVGIAGVGGLPPAVCGEQHYFVNVAGSTLVTGANNWLATSATGSQGNTEVGYEHNFAASNVAMKVRIIVNAITSGTLAVSITRNGSVFSSLTLNNTSSGTLNTATLSVGSPIIGDRWGVLVNGTGTGMTGTMAFTATLLVAPNVF